MDNLTATCTRHDPPVPLDIADPVTDESRVTCPSCGHDFGTWAEVKVAMKKKLENDIGVPWVKVT